MVSTDAANTAASQRLDADIRLVLGVGLVYIAFINLREWLIQSVAGYPLPLTSDYVAQHGTPIMLARFALELSILILLAAIWGRAPKGALRAALRSDTAATTAGVATATAIVLFVLNNLDIWPFTWRWEGDSARPFVFALVEGGQHIGVLLWCTIVAVVIPLVEEVLFRFGVLRWASRWLGSNAAGVVLSSLLFGAIHTGPLPPNRAHLTQALGSFGFAVVLSIMTVRNNGRIASAVAAHITKNSLEVATLLGLGLR
jgi:membrane protease YdiL (CAAX protease family)